MAIPMIEATRHALRDDASRCDSRSLFKDRFADPQAKDDGRKAWFKALLAKKPATLHPSSTWLPKNAEVLHARLESRLMVDLAGGVMENANLNLDRYGLPHIPGSAVKGCARRMALQALHDWIAAGSERPADDDACAPCCEGFKTPAEMLAAIARVFGWVSEDWESAKSDFGWACGDGTAILAEARQLAGGHQIFAGAIAFLPSSPNIDPGLDLDVLTPHHTKYHQGEKGYDTAPDTEDPIPVFFPAVRPQTGDAHFTFPLIPLRSARGLDITSARRWLAHGLELFGLGAKTHAAYGLFQVLAEGKPEFARRFDPILSPVEIIVRQWQGKTINSMSARAFAKQVVDFGPADLAIIFEDLAPGKIRDLKDPFWNPFKTDMDGKKIVELLRTNPDLQ